MAHSMQGAYAPLPQNLSDSESEKELVMESLCSAKYNKLTNGKVSSNTSTSTILQNGFGSPKLKIKHVKPPMSPLRKTAFILSIILCILPVCLFLWVLPCDNFNTCPVKVLNWEYVHENVELKGKINVVRDAFKNSYNLVVMFKSSINSPSLSYGNGVISHLGHRGDIAWIAEQINEPYELDCSIIDVNGNGIKDCLLLDGRGLKAIESVSGTVVWHVYSHDKDQTINQLSMAVELDDFNNDSINELLTIYLDSDLLIVCGKTGKALSSIKMDSICRQITTLQRLKSRILIDCRNGTKIKYFKLPIADLKRKFDNLGYNLKPEKSIGVNKEVIYISGDKKLIVENINCPNCYSKLTLFDNSKQNKTGLKKWDLPNSYIMKPVAFAFPNPNNALFFLRGKVNGFIIKIWEWQNQTHTLLSVPTQKIFKRDVNESFYYVNKIKERFMLIIFNQTDFHVMNATQNDVNQLCLGLNNRAHCHPYHRNQDNSVAIADLNFDDNFELITYSSSYQEKENNTWRLQSTFKVFKLEEELFNTKN